MRRGWGIESEMGREFAQHPVGADALGCAQNIFPLYSAAAFSQPFLTMQRAASPAWDIAS